MQLSNLFVFFSWRLWACRTSVSRPARLRPSSRASTRRLRQGAALLRATPGAQRTWEGSTDNSHSREAADSQVKASVQSPQILYFTYPSLLIAHSILGCLFNHNVYSSLQSTVTHHRLENLCIFQLNVYGNYIDWHIESTLCLEI